MSLRKDVEANKKFSIVIQTYNHDEYWPIEKFN